MQACDTGLNLETQMSTVRRGAAELDNYVSSMELLDSNLRKTCISCPWVNVSRCTTQALKATMKTGVWQDNFFIMAHWIDIFQAIEIGSRKPSLSSAERGSRNSLRPVLFSHSTIAHGSTIHGSRWYAEVYHGTQWLELAMNLPGRLKSIPCHLQDLESCYPKPVPRGLPQSLMGGFREVIWYLNAKTHSGRRDWTKLTRTQSRSAAGSH